MDVCVNSYTEVSFETLIFENPAPKVEENEILNSLSDGEVLFQEQSEQLLEILCQHEKSDIFTLESLSLDNRFPLENQPIPSTSSPSLTSSPIMRSKKNKKQPHFFEYWQDIYQTTPKTEMAMLMAKAPKIEFLAFKKMPFIPKEYQEEATALRRRQINKIAKRNSRQKKRYNGLKHHVSLDEDEN